MHACMHACMCCMYVCMHAFMHACHTVHLVLHVALHVIAISATMLQRFDLELECTLDPCDPCDGGFFSRCPPSSLTLSTFHVRPLPLCLEREVHCFLLVAAPPVQLPCTHARMLHTALDAALVAALVAACVRRLMPHTALDHSMVWTSK